MKSLLKLLGTLTLATTPAIAVVACDSENKQMTPRDILNSAAAFITDSDLKIVSDLNLKDTDIKLLAGKTFSQFNDPVKKAVASFFANKLKKSTDEHPTNWYHPDAHVQIMDLDNDPEKPDAGNFVLPVKVADDKPAVNGHLWVKAEISYASLPPITKNIKVTLNNDKSSDQDKADAIKEFITTDIANLNVNVENLPISGKIDGSSVEEKADIARTQLSYIQQNLNVAIKDKVQYSGLRLSFAFTGDFSVDNKAILFTMKDATTTATADKAIIFNGNINNITISFLVGSAAKSDLDTGEVGSTTAIKVNQTFADAATQIEKVFSDWTVKSVSTLPTATETYDEYNKNNSIEDQFIKDGYFAAINKVYTNLGQGWLDKITITNRDSHFNPSPTGNNGSFSLNFNLEYKLKEIGIDTTSVFNINAEGVHIKLNKTT